MKYLAIMLLLCSCNIAPSKEAQDNCAARCKNACNVCGPVIDPLDGRCWCDNSAIYPE